MSAWKECQECNGRGLVESRGIRRGFPATCPCIAARRAGVLAGLALAAETIRADLKNWSPFAGERRVAKVCIELVEKEAARLAAEAADAK